MKKFEIGSTVVATTRIWNRKGTELLPGQSAVVRNRYPQDAECPTVLAVTLPNGKILIDIVDPEHCFR